MIRFASIVLTALSLVAFVGCKPSGGNNQNATRNPAPADGHAEGDGHDHDHDHEPAADDHGHGEAKPLGTSRIGDYEVKATQFGIVTAGKEASVEIELASLPANVQATNVTVRVWIGSEAGTESVKSKADREGESTHFHAHAEVPSPLPVGAKWWVEIEASGQSLRGSFDIKD
jgi:hypothetical protein